MTSSALLTEPRLAIRDLETTLADLVTSLGTELFTTVHEPPAFACGGGFAPNGDLLVLRGVGEINRSVPPRSDDWSSVASFEYYVRELVASSATTVWFPAIRGDAWACPQNLRSRLPPSLAKRVRFIDDEVRLWSAVRDYLGPVLKSIPATSTKDAAEVRSLAWNVYLFVLAWKSGAEVDLDASHVRAACQRLGRRRTLSSEARGRFAVLEGLFATYDRHVRVATFRVVLSSDQSLSERIDEILDDAHFLEVSALRRFFGIAQNRRAVARDLRKLISWIVKGKKWAAAALAVGSDVVAVPNRLTSVAEKTIDALAHDTGRAPILTTRYQSSQTIAVAGQYSVYSGQLKTYLVANLAPRNKSESRPSGG